MIGSDVLGIQCMYNLRRLSGHLLGGGVKVCRVSIHNGQPAEIHLLAHSCHVCQQARRLAASGIAFLSSASRSNACRDHARPLQGLHVAGASSWHPYAMRMHPWASLSSKPSFGEQW